MSIPTDEQLTRALTRLYRAAHPTSDLPYLQVEEVFPQEISFWVRIGSTTHEVTISSEVVHGPMDYITDCMGLPELVKPEAVV